MAVSKIDNGLQDQINDLNSKLTWKLYQDNLNVTLANTDGAESGTQIVAANDTLANAQEIRVHFNEALGGRASTRIFVSKGGSVCDTFLNNNGFWTNTSIYYRSDGVVKGMFAVGGWSFTRKVSAIYYR